MKTNHYILSKAVLFFLAMAFLANLSARTFSTLYSFSNSVTQTYLAGVEPIGDLVLSDGVLYGGTSLGGLHSHGALYSMNIDGTDFRVISGFSNEFSGSLPLLGGIFYTAAPQGNTAATNGFIFSISTNGDSRIVYQFTGSGDGAMPGVLISDGDRLYGLTTYSNGISGSGIVYSVNTNGGDFKVLHAFGQQPSANALVLKDGVLYGTRPGTNDNIFSLATDGSDFKGLYTFSNGIKPVRLIINQGTLYGIGQSNTFSIGGIVYSIATNGSNFNVLHIFTNTPLGLIAVNSEVLCGSTYNGGRYGDGMVFLMKTNGSGYNVPYDFSDNGFNSGWPSGMISYSNKIWGATFLGGANNEGSIFTLDFVPTLQNITCTNGSFNMVWDAVSGATYQFQYSTNLTSASWFNLGEIITATNQSISILDPATNSQRFYRLIYQP